MPIDESSAPKKTQDSRVELTSPVQETDNGSAEAAKGSEALPLSAYLDSPASRSPQEHARQEQFRPPLPPRPTNLSLFQVEKGHKKSLPRTTSSTAQQLQSPATIAISRTDVSTHSYQDGSRENFATTVEPTLSRRSSQHFGSIRRRKGLDSSEGGDTASIRSSAPTLGRSTDNESLLGDMFGAPPDVPTWKLFGHESDDGKLSDTLLHEDHELGADFYQEFDSIGESSGDEANEEHFLRQWRLKRKHFLILSSAGKPIYSRHGDDNLITSSIGIIQTIISFYEDSQDQLKSFNAAGARFVVMSQGPLYLVAISKLAENEIQLRSQLEALYMQILSTLTLPTLHHLFANRPSTDLRRPLKGTEVLLSALADTFTRGSPTALLSALECLKLKKSQREIINNALLQCRCGSLLYGLVVAGGRLVSVVRPRKHSLHPSDLQLIFNMLFEAEGIKTGGGENWIPLCLPGFNKNGYLYMYVSFISASDNGSENIEDVANTQDTIAILLISANKEGFYDLRKMRDDVVEELDTNGSMALIRSAVRNGRPSSTDVIPGTVLRHFLYKSKGNVQFVMPSYEPYFTTILARRNLLTLYHTLHADVHAKNAHLKVHHCVSRSSISLAWVTPVFELYCVAGPNASRSALAQNANKVIQWVRREEERVFIIGGAVF